jgi:hypothetical protein
MITWSDIQDSFLLAGFLLVISAVIFLLIYGLMKLWRGASMPVTRESRILQAGFQSGWPFGFIGIVAGFLTGSSRSPAVSALVPAVLTFLGLIVVYLMGKSRLRAIIAGFAVFIFSVDLLVGVFLGSASRDRHEEFVGSVAFQRLKAEQEFAIRRYRGALGLPMDVPKPPPPAAPEVP